MHHRDTEPRFQSAVVQVGSMSVSGARVAGKVAVVTGGTSGIGFACARAFLAEGARVVITGRNDDRGASAVKALGAVLGGVRFVKQDARLAADWDRLVDDVMGAFGRVDVLVNNAGSLGPRAQNPEVLTVETWRDIASANVESLILGCQRILPVMRKGGGGSIVNVSSTAAIVGVPAIAGYAAAKGAVRQYTKSVAIHCARAGDRIRCNSVHPAVVDTPMAGELFAAFGAGDATKGKDGYLAKIPTPRLVDAEDVAAAVLFLASDEARTITGAELVIDGGFLAT
jgi:NAD(P)-dependent dehydrogenase (short-subunit alcohol dehydrogenase family)